MGPCHGRQSKGDLCLQPRGRAPHDEPRRRPHHQCFPQSWGLRGIARFAAYCSSKFGIVGLTQALAQELAPHGITVNAICPSLTPTERVGHMVNLFENPQLQVKEATDALLSGAAGSTPIGRLAQTDDLAHAVSFLASDGADFLTGLSLPVTGGSFMR